ncbi:MAG: lyase family protein [Chloroflexia bacterium]
MSKLWDKGYELDSLIERFEIGDDYTYDNELVEPDVLGSLAHAEMLHRIGVLTADELAQLRRGLGEILALHQRGEFRMAPEDEDVHTKIENWLVAELGEVGKKIHTARSRNDQVLLDLRLYAKRKVLEVEVALLSCASELARFAREHEYTPMPGYTHMQRAMLSSVGVWAAHTPRCCSTTGRCSRPRTSSTTGLRSARRRRTACRCPLTGVRRQTARFLGGAEQRALRRQLSR